MKRVFSFLLVALLIFGLLPVTPMSVRAAEESATLSFSSTANRTSFSKAQQVWERNGITFTNDKANSTNNVADYSNPVRLYASSTVTITHTSNNITKIVFTSDTTTKYVTALKDSLENETASSNVITVAFADGVESFSFTCSGQIRLKDITVYYEASAPACEHTNIVAVGDAIAEDCENTGLTAGEKCADCGVILKEQEVIPALGHNYVEGICTNCGDELSSVTVSFSVPSLVSPVENMTTWEGNAITLPSMDDYSGKYSYTFVGWAEIAVSDTETAPTLYKAGSQYTPSGDVTLHAVYTYTVAGSDGATEYVRTNASGIKPGDTVVITTTKDEETYYAMTNGNGTSKAPVATAVSVSNNKLVSAPESTVLWDVGGTAGEYIFYVSGQTSTWLYCTATNNGVRVGTNTANTFKIDSASGYLYHNGTNRYIGIYNNADWRCYTTVNSNITGQTLYFFVKTSGGSVEYYTSTLESADTTCQHTNTTEVTVDPSCTVAGSVTVTCADCGNVISTTVLDALGHTVVTDAAVAATCVNSGLTEGSHCSACNTVLVQQETVPATGEHTYENGKCSVCGEQEPAGGSVGYELVTDVSEIYGGGQFVIVATDGTDYYALPTAIAGKMDGVSVTIQNDRVVYVEGTTPVWTIEKISDTSFALTNGTSYLKYASSTNLGSGTTQYAWTLAEVGDCFKVVSETANRGLVFRASTYNQFGGYAISNVSETSNEYFGIQFYKMINLCSHDNTENHEEVAPTCTTVGYTAGVYCLDCESYTEGHEVVAMIDHSYGEGVVTTAPGCTTTGVMTYTCTACGHSYTESVDPKGHSMGDAVRVEPTCENSGSVTYTCTVCGEAQSETLPATGHSWGSWTQTVAPTCTEAGEETRTCSVCDKTETQSVAALGHNWGLWTQTVAPTCTEAGEETRTCSVCDKTETQPVAALGHDYNGEGVCNNCGAEISHYELVTDYTKILAGGEFVLAVKLDDTFYALHNDATSNPKAIDITNFLTGEGADMMVIWSEEVPVWKVDYYAYRTDCFSLYSTETKEYLSATDSSSLASSDSPWAWTFIDSNNSKESDGDGIYAVDQGDGSVAFVVASATIVDRAISLRSASDFSNYSVRDIRNREVFFFKMVKAGDSKHTVSFIENGQTVQTVEIDETENVIELPDCSDLGNMPEGYTHFLGWVTLPHTESLIAPTTIYSAGDTFYVTEDTKLYALYTREDANAEGQAMSYHLVTDNNQLVQDQMYIIVGYNEDTDTYYAMSKDQLSGDRGASVVVPDSDGVINFVPSDNVAVLKLTQGYKIGSFAFLDVAMNKFLYCASTGSENALKSQAELSNDSSFVITITSGENGTYSIMIAQSTDTTRTNLAYNTISDDSGTYLFSCYDSNVTSVKLSQTYLYVGVPNSTYATYYTTGLCAHQWVLTKHEDASCEHAGYSLYTCSICSEIKMEDIKAHGHTVGNSTVTTAPTCTTTGVATSYCTACDKEFTEILSVVPHTETVTEAVAATCTETGLTEGTHCSVCGVVLTAQEEISALGHDYSGSVTVNEKKIPVLTHQCSRCEDSYSIELKFTAADVTLENTLIVGFKANAAIAGDDGFTNIRAEFEYGNRVGVNQIPAVYLAEATLYADRYSFPCRYITPSQIGDEITATLYGSYDGVEYSYVKKYSVSEYCYNMLGDEAKLNALLVSLLYYCDYARAYTTYKINEPLVTDNLTDDQKKLVAADRDLNYVLNAAYETHEDVQVTWKAAGLVMYHSVCMQFRFLLAEEIDPSTLTVKVMVGNVEHVGYITKSEEYDDQYYVVIDDLAAHEMSALVLVTLYQGEKAISNTISYSVESYVYAKQNDSNPALANLVKAIIRYGDAANAYYNR